MPGYSGDWWIEMNSTSVSRKDRLGAVAVVHVPVEDQHPLGARARSSPIGAAIAALPKKQKPIARDGLGVMARRPQRRDAGPPRPAEQPVDQGDGPAGRTQRRLEGLRHRRGVGVQEAAAARAQLLQSGHVRLGWIVSSKSRSTRGASSSAAPNQSWRPISASSARIRSGRSGWPGMSWASEASWRSQSGGTPVPYGLP